MGDTWGHHRLSLNQIRIQMTNWRTNLGGALGVLGTTLIGVGVVPQLAGTQSKLLTYTATAGFFISAAGKFFHALFAADAAEVAKATTNIAGLQNDVAQIKGDTAAITKSQNPT